MSNTWTSTRCRCARLRRSRPGGWSIGRTRCLRTPRKRSAANNVVDGMPADHHAAAPASGPNWPTRPPTTPTSTSRSGPRSPTTRPPSRPSSRRRRDSYDAVSDVLLAESVHHFVQGNTARAAAVMSAAAGGDAAPVEPEVVRTPTRAAALTHRVLLLLDDTAPGSSGLVGRHPASQGRAPAGGLGRAPAGAGHRHRRARRRRRHPHDARRRRPFRAGRCLRQRRGCHPGYPGSAAAATRRPAT